MCDAFSGTYSINPKNDVSGEKSAFACLRPPDISDEDLYREHTVKIAGQGDKMTVTMNVPGKGEKGETFTVGQTREKDVNGMKVQITSKMDNGHIISTASGSKGELVMDRWMEGGDMKLKISMGGNSCVATFHRV